MRFHSLKLTLKSLEIERQKVDVRGSCCLYFPSNFAYRSQTDSTTGVTDLAGVGTVELALLLSLMMMKGDTRVETGGLIHVNRVSFGDS